MTTSDPPRAPRKTADSAQAADPAPASGRLRGWLDALRVYLEPATWRMLFLGFSAGLPLLLVLGTLGFRLREEIGRAHV